jgi:hypothetical protein
MTLQSGDNIASTLPGRKPWRLIAATWFSLV